MLANQRGLKGSNGFRNNGGHPNHHSQKCYEVADAQASLTSALSDAGQEVDEAIISKLTGKAAVYFKGVVEALNS